MNARNVGGVLGHNPRALFPIVDDKLTLIENPLASARPTELKKSDIAARDKSNVSMMPKGLFDKLTKDEILDLLAYVYSGGNEKHAVYQGAQGHHH